MSAARQHVDRWVRATRNVVEGRAEEILVSADYGPDGPLATLAQRLKVAPEFLFTWTQERSYFAISHQDQWVVVVDFGRLVPLLEMTMVMQIQYPHTAIATILSREMAVRFRCAGSIEEGILFARVVPGTSPGYSASSKEAQGLQECSAVLELYLAAHELAHVAFGENPVFSGEMRAAVVTVVNAFVKSQVGVPADRRDPELAQRSVEELPRIRASMQAGWLRAIAHDAALQEELAADDMARAIIINSRVSGNPLFIAVTLFMIQLNLFVLKNLDVLVCGYQGGDHNQIRANEPLLRSEYAALDLVHLVPTSSAVRKEDLRQRLAEMGIMHKEVFRKALYEHVIPQLSLLDSMRSSRKAAVLATQAGDRQALLNELLSV